MTDETNQLDLPYRPRPARQPQEIPLDVILKQPSRVAVIRLQAHASGLLDDQICQELGIQNVQWSRIMDGRAHFPTEKYTRFNQITGLHCVLLWDLYQAGFDPASIRPLRSDLERKLLEREQEIEALNTRLRHFEDFIRLKGGA